MMEELDKYAIYILDIKDGPKSQASPKVGNEGLFITLGKIF